MPGTDNSSLDLVGLGLEGLDLGLGSEDESNAGDQDLDFDALGLDKDALEDENDDVSLSEEELAKLEQQFNESTHLPVTKTQRKDVQEDIDEILDPDLAADAHKELAEAEIMLSEAPTKETETEEGDSEDWDAVAIAAQLELEELDQIAETSTPSASPLNHHPIRSFLSDYASGDSQLEYGDADHSPAIVSNNRRISAIKFSTDHPDTIGPLNDRIRALEDIIEQERRNKVALQTTAQQAKQVLEREKAQLRTKVTKAQKAKKIMTILSAGLLLSLAVLTMLILESLNLIPTLAPTPLLAISAFLLLTLNCFLAKDDKSTKNFFAALTLLASASMLLCGILTASHAVIIFSALTLGNLIPLIAASSIGALASIVLLSYQSTPRSLASTGADLAAAAIDPTPVPATKNTSNGNINTLEGASV